MEKTKSFRFIENFNIDELVNYIANFNKEWNTTPELVMNRLDSPVDVVTIFKVPLYFNPNTNSTEPLQPIRVIKDDKLYDLISPIIKKIESIYNSKHARIWLAKLNAKKEIPLHVDSTDSQNNKRFDGDYSINIHRIHIPLITNKDVIFNINGEVKNLRTGECWEMNNNIPHSVQNNSDMDRVHLVIDILPEKWI